MTFFERRFLTSFENSRKGLKVSNLAGDIAEEITQILEESPQSRAGKWEVTTGGNIVRIKTSEGEIFEAKITKTS